MRHRAHCPLCGDAFTQLIPTQTCCSATCVKAAKLYEEYEQVRAFLDRQLEMAYEIQLRRIHVTS